MALEIERVALSGNTASGDPFNGILNTSGVNTPSMAGASVSFDDIIELLYSLNAANAQTRALAVSIDPHDHLDCLA